ncbi:MAG: transglycosylase SLT domain-containing protein [Caldithrix sp.]|nr:transglycosylase SLT domain-containing protein [Caldithrix sp.]
MIQFAKILMANILLIVVIGCQTGPQSQAIQPDSLSITDEVKDRLAKKKQLIKMRLELLEGPTGKAIDKHKATIKKYAKRYGFDWRLIAAQIVQESGFNVTARSHVGARGLMQIMPYTAREISRELDIEYIMKSPRENITAGIYHLKKQFRYFPEADYKNRTKLALASYNAGAGRVFDAQDIARYHKLQANKWENVKPYLAMLKRSDWQLHLQVWPKGRPPHGHFYGYNETINYVDEIWSLYEAYQKIM